MRILDARRQKLQAILQNTKPTQRNSDMTADSTDEVCIIAEKTLGNTHIYTEKEYNTQHDTDVNQVHDDIYTAQRLLHTDREPTEQYRSGTKQMRTHELTFMELGNLSSYIPDAPLFETDTTNKNVDTVVPIRQAVCSNRDDWTDFQITHYSQLHTTPTMYFIEDETAQYTRTDVTGHAINLQHQRCHYFNPMRTTAESPTHNCIPQTDETKNANDIHQRTRDSIVPQTHTTQSIQLRMTDDTAVKHAINEVPQINL